MPSRKHLNPSTTSSDEIGRCFDCCATRYSKRQGTRALSRTAKLFAHYLAGAGLEGRSVLEVGSGAGGLTVELVKRGARTAHGFDLSTRLIEVAREHAHHEGLANRTAFSVGDAASVPLPRSDIVILDTVICCYPDARALVEHTAEECESMYCFSVPRDRGLWRAAWYLAAPLYGFYVKIRGCRPHFFIHAVADIETDLRERGFAPVLQQTAWMWYVAVFARQGAVDSTGVKP